MAEDANECEERQRIAGTEVPEAGCSGYGDEEIGWLRTGGTGMPNQTRQATGVCVR